ncbi:unnamed protein product [Meloidogyne enterolobii]|uniref:Uncharacterized protein n=1 Tax=Meloidogyne enterolobii TaxID=390850 RepID=A0ACB1AMJ9_MELEN
MILWPVYLLLSFHESFYFIHFCKFFLNFSCNAQVSLPRFKTHYLTSHYFFIFYDILIVLWGGKNGEEYHQLILTFLPKFFDCPFSFL